MGRLPEYYADSLRVNHSDPNPTCDFPSVDFAQLEEAANRARSNGRLGSRGRTVAWAGLENLPTQGMA